jgi:hypothetical protein
MYAIMDALYFFLIHMILVVMGHVSMLVIGTVYTSDMQEECDILGNVIPVAGFHCLSLVTLLPMTGSLPVTDEQNRHVTGKTFCSSVEFQKCLAILHCMPGHSFSVDERIVYMTWSIQHVIW